jgi:hypothetical protein
VFGYRVENDKTRVGQKSDYTGFGRWKGRRQQRNRQFAKKYKLPDCICYLLRTVYK